MAEQPTFGRLLRFWQSAGARGVATAAIARVVAIRRIVLLACGLPVPPPRPSATLTFRLADEAMLHEVLRAPVFKGSWPQSRVVEGWHRRGDRCVVGWDGDNPVTYVWGTQATRELPGLSWPVGEGRVFVFKLFTAPAYRGRGLARQAMQHLLAGYSDGTTRTAYIDIDAKNEASLRAARGVGFVPAGHFHVVRLGSTRRTFARGVVRATVSGQPGPPA